jgi:aryl carrier-like protein
MKRVNAQSVNVRRPAAASSAEAELVPAAASGTVETAVAEEVDERDGILPHEGAEALRRALSRDLEAPQIVVTAKDLHLMIASVSATNRESLLSAAGAAAAPPAATHERPNIPTPYVAPSTAIEISLAEVWQTTLGIERVGIHDNFFDLGGDSILGIQLIARAGAAGIQLAPDQLFEHQTIAELAKILGAAPQPEDTAEPLPVTAFQRELLAAGAAVPCWYAVWPLPVETSAGAEREVLRQALAAVVARHEALRTRFDAGSGGWTQVPAGAPEELAVREVDLAARTGGADVAGLAREMGAALAPERGLLAAVAVLDGGESPQRALLVVHPLAADGAAWELVRDEVSTACRQLATGGEVALPPVTSSFRRWLAAKLQDVAVGERGAAITGEWLAAQEAAGMPATAGAHPGSAAMGTASVRLSPEETRALLDEIPDLQRVRVEEVLLTALAGSLGRATGGGARVRVEVDARQADPLGLDLARAVGCFTVTLPVRLDLAAAVDPEEELRLAKEQVRGATGQGVEAALFADLAGDGELRRRLAVLPRPELSLTYLGDAQTTAGPAPGAAVAVLGQLDGEGMRFDWTAGDGPLGGAVGRSAAEFLAALRALIEVCRSGAVAVYTPSDFPDAELSQEELDKLFS